MCRDAEAGSCFKEKVCLPIQSSFRINFQYKSVPRWFILLQHNKNLFSFMSELMDLLLTGEDQSQANQPNSLAEGPPSHVNL